MKPGPFPRFGGQLHTVLIASFALVAVLTVVVGTVATTAVIRQYLTAAEQDRVARDMDLAEAFYQLKLDEVAAISHRLVLDRWVIENLPGAISGSTDSLRILDEQISNKITVLALGGTHLIAVLDADGRIRAGRVLAADGSLSAAVPLAEWGTLSIVARTLNSGVEQASTEVIPAEYLARVGLADQARVQLRETPRASAQPFDPREGTAGLALVGVAPLRADDGELVGAALAVYLLNNDFTLVDRIKEVAGIDTVTIFFGDLRISTNVLREDGQRAVGTRISQEVYDVVLAKGLDYVGEAFVVNETYITRYEPLHNHLGQVVGSLYVGARESTFLALIEAFNQRVAVIAVVTIGLAVVLAVPISRRIVRPVARLVRATRLLADGDMDVRVPEEGPSELGQLSMAFNRMVETLRVTQRKLLHQERLASMGQLAAGVAHEINNPLGTIALFTGALRRETVAGDPRREDLDRILHEVDRCKAIVADLLNFAREQEVLAQETDLNGLLDQTLEAVRPHSRFSQVEIVRHYDPDLPMIRADPAQLQQVFVNLLNNSAEAMDGPGQITVETSRAGADSVEVRVTDTGCGIAAEHLGKLFTPFFTTKGPGKGTGLGLSIAYGIIKMHRGQIGVQSAVGRGTTFSVTLPIGTAPEATESDLRSRELVR